MVEKLGEYEGIGVFHDNDMGDMSIVFGDAKSKRMPNGDVIKPFDLYKKSIKREPFIPDNEDFRLPKLSDHKRKIKVKWIIGGPKDLQVYKDAIDYVSQQFSLS